MTPPDARMRLCLYVAGDWPNSQRALTNLRAILVGIPVDLEVVDCLEDPERGMRDGIFYTPTLVKLSPLPGRRILGDLSNREKVLDALIGHASEGERHLGSGTSMSASMPDDDDDKKKNYAVVPQKVTVPDPAPPRDDAPEPANPDLGTSVPDDKPAPP